MNGLKQWIFSAMGIALLSILGYIGTTVWTRIGVTEVIVQKHLIEDATLQAAQTEKLQQIKDKAIETNEQVKEIDKKLDKLLEQKRPNAR